ncbi:hypothetical protein GZH47_33045 (plasmid) [Paenibacillus rhizovicinus]|uniref:Uncharacterized protein n=1 Tax=Paenibacillus rhizovicinus TaxID=2704463 RepID=A0A6C0PCY5_9BACL|nr:hypothetical protein [Paenibacillus rhizovicinus]QHW35722.1 hypothetical protein GZH47_33045 [Paenibacillus rhizovicinus]
MELKDVLAYVPQHAIFTFMEDDVEMQLYHHNEDGWCVCPVGDPACDPSTGEHSPQGRIQAQFVEAVLTHLYNTQWLDRILTYDVAGNSVAYTPFLVSRRLACSAGINGDTFVAEFWDGEKVVVPYNVALNRPFRVGIPQS